MSEHDGYSPPKRQKSSHTQQAPDYGDLDILEAADCAFDGLSLGETMLRLDPTPRPTARAKTLGVYQGGGENNVIYGLSSCFGLRCTVVTALVDDGVGRNIELQLREVHREPHHHARTYLAS